jgi:hypothetical protein
MTLEKPYAAAGKRTVTNFRFGSRSDSWRALRVRPIPRRRPETLMREPCFEGNDGLPVTPTMIFQSAEVDCFAI